MGTWTVEPNEGVTINGSQITFPANSGKSDINYTITYSDSGCATSTTYTISASTECQPTCVSSFTVSLVESSFCQSIYDVLSKDCDDKIILVNPRVDGNKITYNINKRIGGGHRVTIDIDKSKFAPGEDISNQTVNISTPQVEGIGEVSCGVTIVGCCNFDSHIIKPFMVDDVANDVKISVSSSGGEQLSGTVSFHYTIKWKPKKCGDIIITRQDTTGIYNKKDGEEIYVARPTPYSCHETADPTFNVGEFITTDITGNCKPSSDCITYRYQNVDIKKK